MLIMFRNRSCHSLAILFLTLLINYLELNQLKLHVKVTHEQNLMQKKNLKGRKYCQKKFVDISIVTIGAIQFLITLQT